MTVTYVMLARIPAGQMPIFDAYERAVLPLMADYGGQLQRRLRTVDDSTEIHIVSFPSDDLLCEFLTDPRRVDAIQLRMRSGAVVELLAVRDMP